MTGPTGAGKSALAVDIALHLGGEIVGADAFQIYAGLPILTAQPGASLRSAIPHHLVGFLDIRETFDAAKYLREATRCIREIQSRGRVPILTGGTGLYLKALTHGLAEIPKPDVGLRTRIGSLTLDAALEELSRIDPKAVSAIDIRNPVRVRRALEIVHLTGRPLAESRTGWSNDQGLFRGIVLTRDREELNRRIELNVESMFADGVVDEVKSAAHAGEGAARAIGFREIQRLLRGETTESACKDTMAMETRRYAKRQLTWSRMQFNFPALNLGELQTPAETLQTALALLESQAP